MKKALLYLLVLSASICRAQNYQCLQAGVKHYFINGNGYLRGIRIDSVRMMGDTTVYYPFHTPRGSYNTDASTYAKPVLDSNGGSWLGKKVLQKSDGTFIFDSYWNDSVIIRTQAGIGDSWVLYRDTSSRYYKATVVAKDTMTVLSALDSVKTIMVTAYDTGGIVVSDPLDSFKMIISKNHGFVQVFDLYTFPYHKPNAMYYAGLDFFLDRSTHTYNDVNQPTGYSPSSITTIFRLTDFINPNDQQLHNWNVGDVIESYHEASGYDYYKNYILDTVSSRVISGHSISYTLSGTRYHCGYNPDICIVAYIDPCTLITNAGVYTFYDTVYSIADTLLMPEENLGLHNYVFYFPADTNQCIYSPAYVLKQVSYFLFQEPFPVYYKLGIGETQNQEYNEDCAITFYNGIEYTNFNGHSCGTLMPTGLEDFVIAKNTVNLSPNPATTEITISSSSKLSNIAITNLLGQEVFSGTYDAEKATINVADLSPGMYFVRVNNGEVRKFVKQ